jgi:hypothetical protein
MSVAFVCAFASSERCCNEQWMERGIDMDYHSAFMSVVLAFRDTASNEGAVIAL